MSRALTHDKGSIDESKLAIFHNKTLKNNKDI